MKNHIMIDLETLGVQPNAQILSIGAVKFDPLVINKDFDLQDQFYCRIDLDSCESFNFSIDQSTIDWWSKQSPEAIDEAFNSDDRIDIRSAIDDFYKFCWGCSKVWSNGAGFDIVILETVFKRLQKAVPWRYWQVMDCRTWNELGRAVPEVETGVKHNALDDAVAQAQRVQLIAELLRSKGLEFF